MSEDHCTGHQLVQEISGNRALGEAIGCHVTSVKPNHCTQDTTVQQLAKVGYVHEQ